MNGVTFESYSGHSGHTPPISMPIRGGDPPPEWIEDSGHVPHCVKPEAFVAALCRFVDALP